MKKERIISNLVITAIYAVVGFAIISFVDGRFEYTDEYVDAITVAIFSAFISFFIHVIVHELGHLIFGLLTGYKFNSFRIGSLVLQKGNNKYELKKLQGRGTGGQCLMEAPVVEDNWNYPYKLYHLGGILNNLIFSLISLMLYMILPRKSIFCFIFFVIGVASASINALPFRLNDVATDGYNVKEMNKSDEAKRSVWVQLNGDVYTRRGLRPKELPNKWFEDIDVNNDSGVVVTHVWLSEHRVMDDHDFSKAKELIEILLNKKNLASIYKRLLLCDKSTIEVIEKGKDANIEEYYTKDMQVFIRSMQHYPAVIRTKYAIEKLYLQDEGIASKTLDNFNKYLKLFGNEGEKEMERELVEYIQRVEPKPELPQIESYIS